MISDFDHVHVVLNDHNGITSVDQTRQHVQQLSHIREVQAGGGLIEYVEGPAGAPLGKLAESFIRCASPPESVVADWPSFI